MDRYDPYDGNLVFGRLVRRYKRFLADVLIDDEQVTVHCPNPGRLTGLAEPGQHIGLLHVGEKRKLPWSWELSRVGGTFVNVNTTRATAVAAWLLKEGIDGLEGDLEQEVKVDRSRIDFRLGRRLVEAKSVTLARPRQGHDSMDALFPDAPTVRGRRHLSVLRRNRPATMLYVVGRSDCERFRVAGHIDAEYADAYLAARRAGVDAVAVSLDVSPRGFVYRGIIPKCRPTTPGRAAGRGP